jgi:sarcosine oxidase subunit alpha
MSRILTGVDRPEPVTILLDGIGISAFPGETLAAAILMADRLRFRDDRAGRPRGMFCNMGTCSECTVWLSRDGIAWRRVRACLIPVSAGLEVRTSDPETQHG